MFPDNGITLLDRTMQVNEIRVIKSIKDELGFKIINETGNHLFIEIKRNGGFSAPGESNLSELIIRK